MIICPDCKAENIQGTDTCERCGHDLQQLDHPAGEGEFTDHLTRDRLGDLQAGEPPIVNPRDPVAFAIHLMQSRGADCVLVKIGDQVVGILTERDVLLKAAGERLDLNAITVGQTMTPDPVVLRGDDTLAIALHRMSVGEFRHIPLLIDGRVTRVVSIRDVFKHVSAFIHAAPARA
jgi:CBS domain-containing protein